MRGNEEAEIRKAYFGLEPSLQKKYASYIKTGIYFRHVLSPISTIKQAESAKKEESKEPLKMDGKK